MRKYVAIIVVLISCFFYSFPSPAEESSSNSITLSFVGDCSVGDSGQYINYEKSYHSVVKEKGYTWPFSLVSEILKADDLTVANLEVVFTKRNAHVDKVYYLKADPSHVQILKEGGIDIVNTVNNHCTDYYQSGYEDTLATLDQAGIPYFGYTSFRDELAWQDVNGIRIGFIGISYPQSTDQAKIKKRISILREEHQCDLIFVSLHWGRETHSLPESSQITFAKAIIDMGADGIWGHHPHVTQPIHFYKGRPIMYSTGNFTFGTMSKVDPYTGIFQLMYEKTASGIDLTRLQVIPCKTQGSGDYRPMLLTDPEEIKTCLKRLMFTKEYKNLENLPSSFLETGIVDFINGEMIR